MVGWIPVGGIGVGFVSVVDVEGVPVGGGVGTCSWCRVCRCRVGTSGWCRVCRCRGVPVGGVGFVDVEVSVGGVGFVDVGGYL